MPSCPFGLLARLITSKSATGITIGRPSVLFVPDRSIPLGHKQLFRALATAVSAPLRLSTSGNLLSSSTDPQSKDSRAFVCTVLCLPVTKVHFTQVLHSKLTKEIFIGIWYEPRFCIHPTTLLLINGWGPVSIVRFYCDLKIQQQTDASEKRLSKECTWHCINCVHKSHLFPSLPPTLDLAIIWKFKVTRWTYAITQFNPVTLATANCAPKFWLFMQCVRSLYCLPNPTFLKKLSLNSPSLVFMRFFLAARYCICHIRLALMAITHKHHRLRKSTHKADNPFFLLRAHGGPRGVDRAIKTYWWDVFTNFYLRGDCSVTFVSLSGTYFPTCLFFVALWVLLPL